MSESVPSTTPAPSSTDSFAKVNQETNEHWAASQQRTFTKWCNNHLKKRSYPAITNLQTDFETGITLMRLVSSLYDVAVPKHNPNPKMRPHKLDNISLAMKMMDDLKIKTNFLKSTHLVDHDLKMILGMVWSLILDFSIKGISEDNTSAKEGLLLWCRKKTAGYKGVDPPSIQNFSTHWKSGLAFCALIHKHQPHLIDYDSLNPEENTKNLEIASKAAEALGIPSLIEIEDLAVERPDEKSVMTQVAEYFHRFAHQDAKEVAARRAANFIAFNRKLLSLQNDYEQRCRKIIGWTTATTANFQADKAKEIDTVELSLRSNQEFRDYTVAEKPHHLGERLDIENLYAEIQTQLKVFDRQPYVCPEDVTTEKLDQAFEALNEAERAYARHAREQRFKFVSRTENKLSEAKLAEFHDSYKHFDNDQDSQLSKLEFRAALSAMGIPVKDDAAGDALFNKVAQGTNFVTLSQWVSFNTELVQDVDSPEQIKAAFRTLANDSDSLAAEASSLSQPPFTPEDVASIIEAAKSHAHANGGLDYSAFVDASFAKKQ